MADDDLIRRGDALKALDWGDIYGRNAQSAIASLPAQGGRVRPLEWNAREDIKGLHEAFGADGWCRNVWETAEGRATYEGDPAITVLNRAGALFDTLDAAKAAAQADYEARILAALAPAEAGGVEEPISDARLECEALCARFLAGEASEKEVVDTIKKIARANERLAVLSGKHKEQMRLETDMEHIARDMREGRFPERSEPQTVPVAPAPVDALVKAAEKDAAALAAEREKVAKLVGALKPFAEYMADGGDKNYEGDLLPDNEGVGWVYLTVGDFRRARAAITEAGQ